MLYFTPVIDRDEKELEKLAKGKGAGHIAHLVA